MNNPAKLGAPWVVFSEENLKDSQSFHDMVTERLLEQAKRWVVDEHLTILYGPKRGKHRLTRWKLDHEPVRYFDYYGYLLHAGVGEVAYVGRNSYALGYFWESEYGDE